MKLKLVVLFACSILYSLGTKAQVNHKVAFDAKEGEVMVKGKIGNVNPPAELWIYIGKDDGHWDSIPIRNGEFEYRKKTLLPAYGAMLLRYTPLIEGKSIFDNMTLHSIYFEEGTMIVESPVDSLGAKRGATISGSKIHDRYHAYWQKEGVLVRKQRALAEEFNKATPAQLQDEQFMKAYEAANEQIAQSYDSLITEEIRNYPKSLHSYISFLTYISTREAPYSVASKIAQYLAEPYRTTTIKILDDLEKNKKEMSAKEAAQMEMGDQFPAFNLQSPTGEEISSSDFNGKYVLVDFWAAWCVPCRKVNPELVKLYKKYKKKPFEIVGISFDTDIDKWEKAIEEDKLEWVHASDLKGMTDNTGMAMKYGIFFIPQNYLIDPQGKVVAKNLKPDELDAKLKEVLK